MSTARAVIQDSLELLGIYSPGETITDADLQRCLTRLNDMLDSWSNEALTCYTIREQSNALTNGTSVYTIGTGGNFNMARPIRIIEGPGAAYIQDTDGNNYPLDVVPRDRWNLIGNRSSLIDSDIPNTLFYDPQFPLGRINFFPTPASSSYTAYWDSYLPFTTFPSLTATVSLPPGYELALKTNLAVMVKPYFAQGVLDPEVRRQALEAKGNIKRSNMRENIAEMEPELWRRGMGGYSIIDFRSGR